MEKKLIAIYPILYRAHQYKVGDELPTQDAEMVKAWIEAQTAEWEGGKAPKETAAEEGGAKEQEEKAAEAGTEQKEPPKATAAPVTAVAGMEGQSSTGEDAAMIGRVPATLEREKPKVGRSSTRKAPAKPAAKKK